MNIHDEQKYKQNKRKCSETWTLPETAPPAITESKAI